jgi:carboxyl-terminal processing protease
MRRVMPILVFLGALVLAGAAWLAGFTTYYVLKPPVTSAPADVAAPPRFALFNEAWGVVNREFYGKRPVAADVAKGAVAGLVNALGDDYGAYLTKEQAAEDEDPFHPRLIESLGLWVEPVANGAVVLSVVPGSPAAVALVAPDEGVSSTVKTPAILPGDHVLAAGDQPLAGLDELAMVAALSGKPLPPAAGQPVDTAAATPRPALSVTETAKAQLVLQRGDAQPTSVEVPRGAVLLSNVAMTRPAPDTAVLRLSHLDADVLADLDKALAELQAAPAKALVLDLRDNPGGSPAVVQAVAGRFLDGDVWVEVGKGGTRTARKADSDGAPDFPRPERLVVLVNQGTAAGAEQLAAALREGAGARIIGQPTFGKASVQAIQTLKDGSLLRLTVGTWETPSGASVADGGLQPDEAVDGAQDQMDAALAAAGGSVTAGG